MIRQGKNGPQGAHLKICGLTRPADVGYCLARGVAYAGFNLYRGSKRFVDPASARRLWLDALSLAGGPVTTAPVAVVVDLAADELARQLALFPELAAVQFHGAESPSDLERSKAVVGGRGLWKALGVAREADVREAPRAYAGVAELILLDNAKVPLGASVMGGSGQVFEWAWLAGYDAPSALGVAGGVTPENAAKLLNRGVFLIDVSSGVESAPGVKDHARIDALCRIIAL